MGIWLAVDKKSFIHLTHFSTLDENVEVTKSEIIIKLSPKRYETYLQ